MHSESNFVVQGYQVLSFSTKILKILLEINELAC